MSKKIETLFKAFEFERIIYSMTRKLSSRFSKNHYIVFLQNKHSFNHIVFLIFLFMQEFSGPHTKLSNLSLLFPSIHNSNNPLFTDSFLNSYLNQYISTNHLLFLQNSLNLINLTPQPTKFLSPQSPREPRPRISQGNLIFSILLFWLKKAIFSQTKPNHISHIN